MCSRKLDYIFVYSEADGFMSKLIIHIGIGLTKQWRLPPLPTSKENAS